MVPSIIAEFVGSLLLALLTGTWNPLPADRVADVLPAPVAFTAEWHPGGAVEHRSNMLIVLDDGSTRLGGTSSIVSPHRASGLAAGN